MASVNRLAFGLYGRRAGVIERLHGRMRLTYDDTYLSQVQPPTPLSLSLPVVGDPSRTNRAVTAYLAGLLPDHREVRTRWAHRIGVRPGDDLGLVAAVGLDTPGGAVFAPEETLDEALTSAGGVQTIDEAEIAARLRALRADEDAWHEDDDHWSLAGGQGKFTLVRDGDGWGVAVGAAASTHIVKPGIGRIDHQALAEHVSMRALALAGLDVAETMFAMFEDQPAIIVTRDDRRLAGGRVRRVHQEDVLQALAMMPVHKYEADQGPGVARISRLLRSVAGADAVERFADATIAGYVLGAPDGHAKNYSVMLAGAAVALAPVYDVSTGLLASPRGRFYSAAAMSIGGEKRFGDVEAKHWAKFAAIVGQHPDRVMTRVRELATTTPDAFAAALKEVPTDVPGRRELVDVTLPAVTKLARQTLFGLTGSRRSNGRVVVPFIQEISPTAKDPTGAGATVSTQDHGFDEPAGDH